MSRNKYVLEVECHMFCVLYPFMTCLLTLPRIDSALRSLHHVDVDNGPDVSEINLYATTISRVQIMLHIIYVKYIVSVKSRILKCISNF
jgi:hypothetical protein